MRKELPRLTKRVGNKLYIYKGPRPAPSGFIPSPLAGTPESFRRKQYVPNYESDDTYKGFIPYESDEPTNGVGSHAWYNRVGHLLS